MDTPTSFIPGPRRVHRKRRDGASSAPVPPPAANRVVSVTHVDGDDFFVIVDLSAALGGVDFAAGFAVSEDGGTWYVPAGVNLDDPARPEFAFDIAVNSTIFWRVSDPAAWTFADAQPMGEPFDGSIS